MIKSIKCKGKLLNFSSPQIMGVLNYTPDSFSDGGSFNTPSKAMFQIEKMIKEEVDIIDIGAISSRPGSQLLTYKQEKERLEPLLKLVSNNFSNYIFSLDTFRSEIAKWAVNEYNISIINDISAGEFDPNMFKTIGELQVPYIMMHMQGTPENMQNRPVYKNVSLEIIEYFAKKIDLLKQYAVNDIIIDPGFGFGKTIEHNYHILNKLGSFKILNKLILVGLSRKSMIQKVLNSHANDSLNGTTIVNTLALSNGANLLRVHDVKEAKEIVKIFNQL